MAFRDYIVHNFWWKLLSLMLAALTWLTIETTSRNEEKLRQTPVVTGPSSRSFRSVPVTLLTSAANAGRYTVTPTTVTVDVNGKQDDLATLQVQDIKVFVDLTDASDEKLLRKTIQVQMPRDFKAAANPSVASVERITIAKQNPID